MSTNHDILRRLGYSQHTSGMAYSAPDLPPPLAAEPRTVNLCVGYISLTSNFTL